MKVFRFMVADWGGVHSILELNAYIYYCNSSFYILKGPNKNIK